MKGDPQLKYSYLFIIILLAITGLLFTACGGSSESKTYTIGVMTEVPWLAVIFDGFKAGMAELGYVEGKNITYIYHSEVGPDFALFEREAQGFRDQKVDLILTIGSTTTKAAMKVVEGTDMPIITVPILNPVEEGIVASINRPGGNVTGVQIVDQNPKAVEWLLKIVPGTKKVYIPYNPADDISTPYIKKLQEAAPRLGVELLPGEASSVDQVLAAIQTLPKESAIFIIVPLPSLEPGFEAIGKLAAERGIPIGTCNRLIGDPPFPIFTFSVEVREETKQAARLVDQIFKGTKPAMLPVETAEYFLTINLKKAQEIGLNIPDEVLRQADTVVR